jgi:hypothetical protein
MSSTQPFPLQPENCWLHPLLLLPQGLQVQLDQLQHWPLLTDPSFSHWK